MRSELKVAMPHFRGKKEDIKATLLLWLLAIGYTPLGNRTNPELQYLTKSPSVVKYNSNAIICLEQLVKNILQNSKTLFLHYQVK